MWRSVVITISRHWVQLRGQGVHLSSELDPPQQGEVMGRRGRARVGSISAPGPWHREALQQGRDKRCRTAGTSLTGQLLCPQGETARAVSQQPARGRAGVQVETQLLQAETLYYCLEGERKEQVWGKRRKQLLSIYYILSTGFMLTFTHYQSLYKCMGGIHSISQRKR